MCSTYPTGPPFIPHSGRIPQNLDPLERVGQPCLGPPEHRARYASARCLHDPRGVLPCQRPFAAPGFMDERGTLQSPPLQTVSRSRRGSSIHALFPRAPSRTCPFSARSGAGEFLGRVVVQLLQLPLGVGTPLGQLVGQLALVRARALGGDHDPLKIHAFQVLRANELRTAAGRTDREVPRNPSFPSWGPKDGDKRALRMAAGPSGSLAPSPPPVTDRASRARAHTRACNSQ